MMLQDSSSYVRVQNIFNAENFDRTLRPAAEFIAQHVNDYKTMPVIEQIAAATGIKLNHIPDLTEDQRKSYTDYHKTNKEYMLGLVEKMKNQRVSE
jgi:hypothetical protein